MSERDERNLGVLPNEVNRKETAEVALVFGTLPDGLDEATAQQWLTAVQGVVHDLESHQGREEAYASAVFGLGPRFFARFPNRAENTPHGFLAPPTMPGTNPGHDFFFHITHTSEVRFSEFTTALTQLQPNLIALDIERGYTGRNRREAFGQLDGVRNLSREERQRVTAIDRHELPEEPAWLEGACYAAYLKCEQHRDRWQTLDATTHEHIIGRRTADGSRLDLQAGNDPKTEPPFADPSTPPLNSHIRKTGPRGALHDQTLIFRRGAPYIEETDNTVHVGLQFVSYQSSLTDFDVVLNRWMLNNDFPNPNTGPDALVAHNLISFHKAGIFVVVPYDKRFPAAGFFDPKPAEKPTKTARIHIRKTAVDQSGTPVNAEVGGIEFQAIDPTTGNRIGQPATTNPAGRAALSGIPIGTTVWLRETTPDRFEPTGDQEVTVDSPNTFKAISNRLKPNVPTYG